MAIFSTRRHQLLSPRAGSQQPILDRKPWPRLKLTPLFHRDENSLLYSAARDNLRAAREAGVQHLAETSLRVLNLPCVGHDFVILS